MNNLSLESRSWNAFFIEDIAEIVSGRDIYEKERLDGLVPYITATANNNGIGYFVANNNDTLESGCLSVNRNGSVGYCFYHPYEALYGNDTRKLRPKKNNRYVALFISLCITKQREKYGYGYKMGTGRLKRQKILLPVDANNNPDWDFMESYMKQKEHQILESTIEQLCKRLINKEISGGGKLLSSQWKPFSFTDVFTEIQRGKRLKKADHTEGSIPYVSSTALNNGVDGFIGNEGSVRKFEDCITIANSGSVGSAFFHQYEFVASDHVTQLKRKGLDKYAYLFMVPIINRLSEKYSFNREINDERIKREKILLPINDKGEIDFDFMSSFMQEVEADILKTTLKVFKKRLNANENKMGGVKWKAFFLEEIAQISSGKDIYERERTSGQTPYVTATANNNGIGYFVGNQNETLEKGSLSVNRNGSVGYCFYHPYDALYGNDTRKLKPIRNNKYVSLFISMCITNQRAKYGYGYKMGTGRLKRQKILLPIDGNSQPNWDYMEAYMQNLEQQQILEYLRHIER